MEQAPADVRRVTQAKPEKRERIKSLIVLKISKNVQSF
jgi:hypothetical protein